MGAGGWQGTFGCPERDVHSKSSHAQELDHAQWWRLLLVKEPLFNECGFSERYNMARCSLRRWKSIPNAEEALPNFHFFPWATKVLGLLRRNSRIFLTWIIQWVFLVLHLKMVWLFWLKFSKRPFTSFQLERSKMSQNYKEMKPGCHTRRWWTTSEVHWTAVLPLRSS